MKTWAGAAGSLPRTRYLTAEEVGRVLSAIERVTRPHTRGKYRMLFLLLVNLGPRISEAVAVRVRDVQMWEECVDGKPVRRGSITFPTFKRWTEDGNGRRYRVPLSRTLPLSPELIAEVDQYVRVERLRPRGLLFPKVWRKYPWQVFKRALQVAGLSRHYRLHDLRHSAGTYLADKTRDPALVRDVLGHASIATSNIYIHTVQMREKLLRVPTLLPGHDGRERLE